MPVLTHKLLAAKSALESDRHAPYPEIAHTAGVSTSTVHRAVEKWPHLKRIGRRPSLAPTPSLEGNPLEEFRLIAQANPFGIASGESLECGVFDSDGAELQALNLMDHWPEAGPRSSDRMELGNILITGGVGAWAQRSASRMEFVLECLERHRIGDWGEVDAENQSMNDELATSGKPVISCYQVPVDMIHEEDFGAHRLWSPLFVMTAAENTRGERVRTTLLWSHEY